MKKYKIYCRLIIVLSLTVGLVLAPTMPHAVLAAEREGGDTKTDDDASKAAERDSTAGADVSGIPDAENPAGKGALAPPPEQPAADQAYPKPQEATEPIEEPQPIEKEEATPEADKEQKEAVKKPPTAIGASAGKAGSTSTKQGKGMSLGWKITAGVLGVGLLLGVAGGGGGGGGGGGTTTPSHGP